MYTLISFSLLKLTRIPIQKNGNITKFYICKQKKKNNIYTLRSTEI